MTPLERRSHLFRYVVGLRDRPPTYDEAKELAIDKAHELGMGGNSKAIKIFDDAWESERRRFPLTPIGNGDRFISRHGKNIRFCPKQNSWYIWDGKRWAEDKEKKMMGLARDTVDSIRMESMALPEGDSYRENLNDHWKRSHNVSQLKALIDAASIDGKIKISLSDLDNNKMVLNCNNGTLNLKTGELLPHDRDHLITKITPIDYDPNAKCRVFLNFIHRATGGSRELANFIQRVMGYGLTGVTDEKCLFFLFGGTDTGKTTLVETIRELMGEYASGTDFNTFIFKKYTSSIRNDIARLEGARFVSASEAGEHQKFDETLIKQITGRDTVVARFLYKEFKEFTPEFKILLAANHRPKITGVDDAIWNRIVVIPFSVRIPKREQDKNLYKKLRDELPGILAWAVRGCLEWQRIGLQAPPEVKSAINIYRAEADVVERFINDRCRRIEDGSSKFNDLFNEWKEWCSINQVDPGTEKNFAQILNLKGFQSDRERVSGTQHRIRKGLVLNFVRNEKLAKGLKNKIKSKRYKL